MKSKMGQNIPRGVGWTHMIGRKPEMNGGPEVEKESIGCCKGTTLKDEDNGLELSPWTTMEEDASTAESIKKQRRINMRQ
jgi:hypothetical protein